MEAGAPVLSPNGSVCSPSLSSRLRPQCSCCSEALSDFTLAVWTGREAPKPQELVLPELPPTFSQEQRQPPPLPALPAPLTPAALLGLPGLTSVSRLSPNLPRGWLPEEPGLRPSSSEKRGYLCRVSCRGRRSEGGEETRSESTTHDWDCAEKTRHRRSCSLQAAMERLGVCSAALQERELGEFLRE
ncbi:uncharacterized protein LOC144578783 [Callithrix jacchus]